MVQWPSISNVSDNSVCIVLSTAVKPDNSSINMPSKPSKVFHASMLGKAPQQLLHRSVTHVAPSAVSSLYSTPAQPPRLEAVPTEQDFIAALQGLGINTEQAGKGAEAPQQCLSDSQEQQPAKGTMYHLQLVLRTLAAVYRCNSKVDKQTQELSVPLHAMRYTAVPTRTAMLHCKDVSLETNVKTLWQIKLPESGDSILLGQVADACHAEPLA